MSEKNYETMKEELIAAVKKLMEESHPELQMRIQSSSRTNGVIKDSITFTAKAGGVLVTSPILYLSDFLERVQEGQDYTILDAAEAMVKFYEMASLDKINEDVLQRIQNVDKTKIVPEVVNLAMNKEMLSHTPYRIIADDLAMIARYELTDHGTAVVSNELTAKLLMTPSEVLDAAAANVHGSCQTMYAIMANVMDVPEEQAKEMMGDNGMYVISNESKVYGAATIFLDRELRQEVAEKFHGDFYILPSSIHEVICISADTLSPEEANKMICVVNSEQLMPEEVLSDHCYHVNAQTLKITNPLKEAAEEKITKKAVAKM